jgi:hypothetical protein
MSAKLETFFELKKVTDHDCGNYQIGEIDFVNYAKIREYIAEHGELGFRELIEVCHEIIFQARDQRNIERMKAHQTAACGVYK